MKNVPIKQIVIGKEYVFGSYSEALGFVPTRCDFSNQHPCRLTVEKVGRKYIDVRFANGSSDKRYCGDGFFEIDLAKDLYKKSLKARQSKGYPQTDAEIDSLVEAL